MEVRYNAGSATWHLVGSRGCGATPEDETLTGTWAHVRDHVERHDGSKCQNCNWPRSR